MNLFFFTICLISSCIAFGEAFFLFKEKKALLFCLKICPLYCSKRTKRDMGPWSYIDDVEDEGPPWKDWPDDDDVIVHSPHHFHYYIPLKPKPTTTPAPTTTEEPTYICYLCQEKCAYSLKKKS